MKAIVTAVTAAILTVAIFGCSSVQGDECLDEANCPDPGGPGGPDGGNTNPAPLCADIGKPHVGLGGEDLSMKRNEGVAGADRGRTKPFSALSSEYSRVLGTPNNPTLLAQSAATFGESDARWYQEPQPNAVSLFQAYRVAFDGCLQLTGAVNNASGSAQGDAKYGTAPTADTAKTECEAWARKFWSRAASTEEAQACVTVAVSDSAKETFGTATTDTPPKRRWAYACASVLSATGFLAY